MRRLVNQVIAPKTDKEIKPKVAQVVCEYLNVNPDDILEEECSQGKRLLQHNPSYKCCTLDQDDVTVTLPNMT